MARKPTLSPTRIATYLECAVRYRFIYIDKLGRFYLRARPGFSFGSTLHQVLQAFHEEIRAGAEAKSADGLVEAVSERWISAGYSGNAEEAEFRRAAEEIVRGYHAALSGREGAPVETLYTEKTISTDMGPFRLQGRVDRVDRHADGTLEIVDYKSGRLETSAEEVDESLAMRVYQLILRRTHPDVPVVATIHALRGGITATSGMTDEEADRFGADILAIGEEMLNRDFEAVRPKRIAACNTCEFVSRCDAWWRQTRDA